MSSTNFTEAEINGFLMKKRELNHKYYEANKDKLNEKSRKYSKNNRDAINARAKKRRDDKREKDEEENLKKIK